MRIDCCPHRPHHAIRCGRFRVSRLPLLRRWALIANAKTQPDNMSPTAIAGFASSRNTRVPQAVCVGGMYASRETWVVHDRLTLGELIELKPLPPDAEIRAIGDESAFYVVDLDAHHLHDKPSDEELRAVLADIEPKPEAAWITQNAGLKLLYLGPFAKPRALAAIFSKPKWLTAELLAHTRHPLAVRSDSEHPTCGEVAYFDTDPEAEFAFRIFGPPNDDERDQALAELGLEIGKRYHHDRCPICPDANSDASDCVSVLDGGVYCHRCATHGERYAPDLKPGFLPYSRLVQPREALLSSMARHWVHWAHAVLVFRHEYPDLSEQILADAYRLALGHASEAGSDDPRIPRVFDPDLCWVWGEGTWLNSRNGEPIKLDRDQGEALPCVRHLKFNNQKGQWQANVKPAKCSNARNLGPEGYPVIRPVRGLMLKPSDGVVPHLFTKPKHPIELLSDPLPLEGAFGVLNGSFPQVSQSYLLALLSAMICGECGAGHPPMITCDGPSGSGKGETVRLAASFMGDAAEKCKLHADGEKFFREIGSTLAHGARMLQFDEVGKNQKLVEKMEHLLQISRSIEWRPLYNNSQIRTPVRCGFVFTSASFPEFLSSYPEFRRRTFHVRLHRQVPNWADTSGGDTAEWRDRDAVNARVANSILTYAYRMCRGHGFSFPKVARALDLQVLGDEDGGVDPEILKSLYRHARNEDGERVLFEGDSKFVKGWVKIDGNLAAEKLFSHIIPLDEADELKKHQRHAQALLQNTAWNDLLEIEGVPMRCRVLLHGRKWGFRFEAAEAAARGRRRINEQLPPIGGDAAEPSSDSVAADALDSVDSEYEEIML